MPMLAVKQRDHLGVQGVGLGEATERPGAIPDLTRVDHRSGSLAPLSAAATVISKPPILKANRRMI